MLNPGDISHVKFSGREKAVVEIKRKLLDKTENVELLETVAGESLMNRLARVDEIRRKYCPKSKTIGLPKVEKMERLTPIDCFLNISLTNRGFKKCKFDRKPFAKITQPLKRAVSFNVSEGLWRIKDVQLERECRPKVPRDVLKKAARFFKIPLDDFSARLLTRIWQQCEERSKTPAIPTRIPATPIWRVSLREMLVGLDRAGHSTRCDRMKLLDLACALTFGRYNVSNWHSVEFWRKSKSKNDGRIDRIQRITDEESVREYFVFIADPGWHLYCIK